MDTLANFPYSEIQFTKRGEVFAQEDVDACISQIEGNSVTDLILISHGWKNDIADARNLYTKLITNFRDSSGDLLDGRSVVVCGVFWPSKKYTPKNLQPGGGASTADRKFDEALAADIDSLAELSDDDAGALSSIEQLKVLLPKLKDKRTARDEFVSAVMQLLFSNVNINNDPEVEGEIPRSVLELGDDDVLELLGRPSTGEVSQRGGANGAVGLGDIWNGLKGGVANFLSIATYWKMKHRAGLVGMLGLREVLLRLHSAAPNLRVHLVGHSFGGRVVSAALRNHGGETPFVASLTLLQAASAGGGRIPQGYFESVIRENRVSGPIAITHTKNDRAVGIAYPLASRVDRDNDRGLGDANDQFGAIGSNGAQESAAQARTMHPFTSDVDVVDAASLEPGRIHNLKADDCISHHNDVANAHVGRLLARLVASTS